MERAVGMLGTQDLLIGLALVFFLFGAKRLPELAGSLAKSMKEFKKGVEGGTEEAEAPKSADELPPTPPVQRVCAACQASLEMEWKHCPRCGSAVPAGTSASVPS
jgi:sec-independent protein translocase protein TatA